MFDARHLEVTKATRDDRNPTLNLVVLALVLCLSGLTVGCSSLSQNAGTTAPANSNSKTALTLSPNTATVASLGKLQFVARISGSPNTAVTWATSAGTISSDGTFTAPNVIANTPVTITATGASNSTTTSVGGGNSTVKTSNPADPIIVSKTNTGSTNASATVLVTAPASVRISTSALPAADVGTVYTTTLSASGGVAPYHWNLSTGALPSGIQLQASSGVITGTTSLTGAYPVTAKVTDATGQTATAPLSLTVSSAAASGFDGPAELPRIMIESAMLNTPATGTLTTVSAGGNLQSALNAANCGDTIQLQAGATFTGSFTFPAKNCDDNHWIIVRTSADDSTLPAENSRLTPCYAGVASLPGRPVLQCASVANVLARVMLDKSNNGPITFATGANHYRLMGLEITRPAGTGVVTALASMASNGTANKLIFDRVWMHGTAQDETTRGIDLDGETYVSIVDSFFTDFHCISVTGSCTDSQSIFGGLGNNPNGPYKIVNNFLEASGETILFGGGAATTAPADIQISRNHMFKPLTWMKGQPGYVGGSNGNPFAVKNLFELKNAQRVLLEGNRMENVWGGFSQVGFAILLTPKSQAGNGKSNLCPTCVVTDVTIRYNWISHVAAGLQIANALSDNGGAALEGERYSIHDIVIDDIDGVKYGGPGEFAQISISAGAPLLQNLSINHVTAFPQATLFVIGDQLASTPPIKNFVFTNSIVNAGTYPVWSSGNGGTANCAVHDIPLTTFNACFTSSSFKNNAIITAVSGTAATWPSPNSFPASTAAVGFTNYNAGNGGDYRLQPSSPYKGVGTDGKDLGADMDGIDSATAGVE